MIYLSEDQKQVLRQWVATLRSGNYQQGYVRMRNYPSNRCCCLGVLCDIVDPAGWQLKDDGINSANEAINSWRHRDLSGDPEQTILNLAGLTHDQVFYFIALNDERLYSFWQIADYIETAILKEAA